MADYHLLTTWDIAAPVDAVWKVLSDVRGYPRWFKYVQSVTEIRPNGPDGTGGLFEYVWKTALPYSLAFHMTPTRFEPPCVMEANARGELEGVGRWELREMEGITRVTYDWHIHTTRAWMNLLAPLARPAFIWNHNTIMAEGGRGLAKQLGVKLLANEKQTL